MCANLGIDADRAVRSGTIARFGTYRLAWFAGRRRLMAYRHAP